MIRALKMTKNGSESLCDDLERGDHALVWVDNNWSHVLDEWRDAEELWGAGSPWHDLESARINLHINDVWSREADGIWLHAVCLSEAHEWNPRDIGRENRFMQINPVVEDLADKFNMNRPLKMLAPGFKPGPRHLWDSSITYGFINAVATCYTETEMYIPC